MSLTAGVAFVDLLPRMGKDFGDAVDKAVEPALKRIGDKMSSVGKDLTKKVTLPIAAGMTAAVMEAGKVDSKLREVVTLTGEVGSAADAAFSEFQAGVSGLSSELGIAQETLTGGLYQALSAGVPRDNAFEFMRVASQAAIAGVTDTETAVDGLSTIINAFGLTADDAGAVADSMFTTVKGGKTTFDELSGSLFQVAPAASSAGIAFTEVNAGLAALTAQGVPTSVAAGRMRAAIDELAKPGTKVGEVFEQVAGKSFREFIAGGGTLEGALQTLQGEAERTGAKVGDYFSSIEAAGAATTLAGTGAEKFRAEIEAQGDAAGATSAAFEEIDKGRNLERLRTTMQNLAIEVGNVLLPVVQEVAAKITPWVQKFGELDPRMKRIVVLAAGLAAALGPVLIISGKMISAFSGIKTAIGGASLLGMGPLLPVALAVAAAALLIWKNWDKVRPVFEAAKSIAEQLFGILFKGDFTGGFLSEDSPVVDYAFRLRDAILNTIDAARQIIGVLFEGDFKGGFLSEDSPIIDAAFRIRDVIADLRYWAETGFAAIKAGFTGGGFFSGGNKFLDFFVRVGEVARTVFEFVKRNAKPILAGLAAAFLLVTAPITTVVAGLILAYTRFETFRNVVNAVVGFVTGTLVPALTGNLAKLIAFFQEIAPQVAEALGHVQRVVVEVFGVIRTIVETVLGVLAVVWRAWGDDLLGMARTVFGTIQELINAALQIVAGVIRTVLAVINGDWGKAWEGVKQILRGAWDFIFGILRGAIGIIRGILAGIVSTMGEVLRPVGNFLHTWLVKPFEGFLDFLGRVPGNVTRLARGMFDGIRNAFRDALNFIIRAWNSLEFKIPGFKVGPVGYDGFTLGVPDIPELRAKGGPMLPGRSYIVGEGGGPELLKMGSIGGRTFPHDQLAGALAGGGRGGVVFEKGAIQVDGSDLTADELVGVVNTKLGWKLTTRNDR